MARLDSEALEIVKRLQSARMSLLKKHPFYALLLMRMKFALDKSCGSTYTDGERIAFNPDFINELSEDELEFVLIHNVLHAALGHPFRFQANYELEVYDMACDIVVNSNILNDFDMDKNAITLKKYGVMPHLTPEGKDGYLFTLEEVYRQLLAVTKKKKSLGGKGGKATKEKDDDEKSENSSGGGKNDDEKSENSSGGGKNDDEKSEQESDKKQDKQSESTSCSSAEQNSATKLSLEELIASIKQKSLERKKTIEAKKDDPVSKTIKIEVEAEGFDDHTFWQGDDETHTLTNSWQSYVMQATDLLMEKENSHKGFGGAPLWAQRLVKDLREPRVDWRALLNEFVQEEVNDYSFAPPDKRMDECPFFLPDFNEKDDTVKNVWFLIDTSGSIGDGAISAAYSEIASAIDMFDGKLEGLLSFTEVFVTEPIPFCSIDELLKIKPVGGGGNDFGEIFRYMQKNMMDNPPSSIIILTDGYDKYPDESEAMGVPVLWLLNNDEAEAPKWGRFARFNIDE